MKLRRARLLDALDPDDLLDVGSRCRFFAFQAGPEKYGTRQLRNAFAPPVSRSAPDTAATVRHRWRDRE
jgi:hypothetical protein